MSAMCQSCGMPLKKDEREGKMRLDNRYCSLCFVDGDFSVKNVTSKQFQDQTVLILREQGWSQLMAWFATRMIPRLSRWKRDNPDQL